MTNLFLNTLVLSFLTYWSSFFLLLFLGLSLGFLLFVFLPFSFTEVYSHSLPLFFMYFIITFVGGLLSRIKSQSDYQKSQIGQIMAAAIAHELRYTFSIALGYLSDKETLNSLFKDKNARSFLQKLKHTVEEGSETLESLLLQVKEDHTLQVSTFKIEDCLKSAIKTAQGSLNFSDIKLTVNLKENFFVKGDFTLLKLVFLNLLKNAKESFTIDSKKNIEICSYKEKGHFYNH